MTQDWIWRRCVRGLRRRAFSLALVWLAVVGSVAAVRVCLTFTRHEAAFTQDWIGRADVLVTLAPHLERSRQEALASAFSRLPGVAQVTIVDAAVAQQRLQQAARSLLRDPQSPGVAGHSQSPEASRDPFGSVHMALPSFLEVRLTGGLLDSQAARIADGLAERLGTWPEVMAVDSFVSERGQLRTWAARHADLLWMLTPTLSAGLLLGWLVWLFSQRNRNRAQAQALSLLGATPMAQRIPAVIAGAAVGFFGMAVGLALGATIADADALVGAEWWLLLSPFVGAWVGALTIPAARSPDGTASRGCWLWGTRLAIFVMALGHVLDGAGAPEAFAGAPVVFPSPVNPRESVPRMAQILSNRARILSEQFDAVMARARAQATVAYRLVRRDQSMFFVSPTARAEHRAQVVLALTVLSATQAEASALADERKHVQAEREIVRALGASDEKADDTENGAVTGETRSGAIDAETSAGGIGSDTKIGHASKRGLDGAWLSPVKGKLLAHPGPTQDLATGVLMRSNAYRWLGRAGEKVVAPADGRVAAVHARPSGGFAVVIEHGDTVSIVEGLRQVSVTPGEKIQRAETLGLLGRTLDGAAVVSLELWRDGAPITMGKENEMKRKK